MFSSLLAVALVSAVAAQPLRVCLPAFSECDALTAEQCAQAGVREQCEPKAGGDGERQCACRNDGFWADQGWLAWTGCALWSYDCEFANEPGVGLKDAALCTGACEIRELDGAERDEWRGFRHDVSRHGCVAYANADAAAAQRDQQIGLCFRLPTQKEKDSWFYSGTFCERSNGVVGFTDERNRGAKSLSKYACGFGHKCCVPRRVRDVSVFDDLYLAAHSDELVASIESPARLDLRTGNNYFIGEQTRLQFSFDESIKGKTLEARIVEDEKHDVVLQTFVVEVPDRDPSRFDTADRYVENIELLGNYRVNKRYVVLLFDGDEELPIANTAFEVVPPPCFKTVSIEYRDEPSSSFGGVCVQNAEACDEYAEGDMATDFFPQKHCRALKTAPSSDYGCCVPRRGYASVRFRENVASDEKTLESSDAATLGASALLIAAANAI